LIRLLAAFGLAWDLKLPTDDRMAAKRISKNSPVSNIAS
jgi:hypothetical protein